MWWGSVLRLSASLVERLSLALELPLRSGFQNARSRQSGIDIVGGSCIEEECCWTGLVASWSSLRERKRQAHTSSLGLEVPKPAEHEAGVKEEGGRWRDGMEIVVV